jgi:hypothetical protein
MVGVGGEAVGVTALWVSPRAGVEAEEEEEKRRRETVFFLEGTVRMRRESVVDSWRFMLTNYSTRRACWR